MEAFLAFCFWAGGWALAAFLFVVGILGAWMLFYIFVLHDWLRTRVRYGRNFHHY